MQISILKGSTPVYVEKHTTTTNDNGLATLEVGGGTPVSGSFIGIDWSSGTYFIKTETDPSGGTNYSITGTSQLLSVPYALYAKTSGSLKQKSISLNVYGSNIDGAATFNIGFGRFAGIFMPDNQISSFTQNFTLPADYISGDTIFIRMLVSSTATGSIDLYPNFISVARAGVGFIAGVSVSSGLELLGTVNIPTADTPYEIKGFIVSPDGVNAIAPGDGISFGFYRGFPDANTGTFKIHDIQILY
jgi:hypothetical protein